MSTEVKNFSFPLFSFVVDVENGIDGYYLCLHQEGKKADGQFCGHIHETFDKMIEHYVLYHSCPLKKRRDYCGQCHTVFDSKYTAIIHGLTHILEYQEDELLLEINNELTMDMTLAPVFDALRQQREIVMNHQMFEGEDPFIGDIEVLESGEAGSPC